MGGCGVDYVQAVEVWWFESILVMVSVTKAESIDDTVYEGNPYGQ